MSRLLHAICPVRSYVPAEWAGWSIRATESIQAPAGVAAHAADHRTRRAFPARELSLGAGWHVHHLTKRMDGGSR